MGKLFGGGIVLLFVGVGVGFLGYGLLEISKASATQAWPSVSGELTSCELKSHRSSKSTTWNCQVKYRYQVDGATLEGSRIAFGYVSTNKRRTHDALYNRLKKAQRVTVFYNPANPSQSVLAPGVFRSAYLPVVFGGTWLTFCIGIGAMVLLEGATATIAQRVVVFN